MVITHKKIICMEIE